MDRFNTMVTKIVNEIQTNGKAKEIILPEFVYVDKLLSLLNPNNDNKAEYSNDELCSACGGQCCKAMGCHISPNDIKNISYETLNELLETGLVSIDWWDDLEIGKEIMQEGYYLRMRNANSDVVDPAYAGNSYCASLTNKGCALEFKYRPEGGRKLMPKECYELDKSFSTRYDTHMCAIDWHQYRDILIKLKQQHENK